MPLWKDRTASHANAGENAPDTAETFVNSWIAQCGVRHFRTLA